MKNQPTSKPFPPKTKALLTSLAVQRNELQAALDGVKTALNSVVAASRELMDVPDDWQVNDIEVGFEAPSNTTSTTGA